MEESLSKAKLSQLRKYLQKKTREADGCFLIEGWHLLEEALREGRTIRSLVYDQAAVLGGQELSLLKRAMHEAARVWRGSAAQISQLADTRQAQGVVALLDAVGGRFDELVAGTPREGRLRLALLDQVGDPGNCGTIVRTCDWFGFDGAVFGLGCAELENGKTARASMGGLFRVPVAVKVDLTRAVPRLQEQGVTVLSLEVAENAQPLDFGCFPKRAAVVLGNEARGVSPGVSALADRRLMIPRRGGGESLNAAVAFAVCAGVWTLAERA